MSGYRSPLGQFSANWREPDPLEAYRLKKKLWREDGILVINLDEDLNWDGTYGLKQTLTAVGDRLYTKRKST